MLIVHCSPFIAQLSRSFQLIRFYNLKKCFSGLITTTSRKLDREQQAEHFLEVLNTSLPVP